MERLQQGKGGRKDQESGYAHCCKVASAAESPSLINGQVISKYM